MQHLLIHVNCDFGVGHYRRVGHLVRALHQHRPDWFFTIMTGGPAWPPFARLPRCQIVPLPGMQYQSIEKPELIGVDGQSAESVLVERLRMIEETLATARISTILFECFPFASQLQSEEIRALVAVVRRNRPTAQIFSSVRDIIWNQRMKASPEQWKTTAQALTDEWIDGILVHSDPTFLPFDYCWGGRPAFAEKVFHTGFVTEQAPPLRSAEPTEVPVVCSVGGGKDGLSALRIFLGAWEILRRGNGLPRNRGQVFTGLFDEGHERATLLEEYQHLFTGSSGSLQMGSWERYRDVAAGARASVSMCGYNTCYELLSWGVPTIFLPRASHEQTTRARLVQERGWAQVAGDSKQLADALQRAWDEPHPSRRADLDFNGAAQAARILGELCRAGA